MSDNRSDIEKVFSQSLQDEKAGKDAVAREAAEREAPAVEQPLTNAQQAALKRDGPQSIEPSAGLRPSKGKPAPEFPVNDPANHVAADEHKEHDGPHQHPFVQPFDSRRGSKV